MKLTNQQVQEIQSLEDANGDIDPNDVIVLAQDPNSSLHNHPAWHHWDVNVQAQQHRVDVAKRMIKFVSIQIVVRRRTLKAPRYGPKPRVYRYTRHTTYTNLQSAARRRDEAKLMIAAEVQRIFAAVQRLEAMAHVLGLSPSVQQLLDCVTNFRESWNTATARPSQRRSRSRRRSNQPAQQVTAATR